MGYSHFPMKSEISFQSASYKEWGCHFAPPISLKFHIRQEPPSAIRVRETPDKLRRGAHFIAQALCTVHVCT